MKNSLATQLPYLNWQEIQVSLNSIVHTNCDVTKCMKSDSYGLISRLFIVKCVYARHISVVCAAGLIVIKVCNWHLKLGSFSNGS